LNHQVLLSVEVYYEVDRFEKDGILRVVLLYVLGHFQRGVHNLLERFANQFPDM
jgi:hypothetical protein